MHRASANLPVLAALAAILACPPARAAGPAVRIAVMPFHGPDSPPQRKQFEKAAAEGFRASGAEVVDATETERKIVENGDDLKGCETPACLATVAQRAGTSYLLRGWVSNRGPRNYKVHLEMVDGAGGAALGGEDFACEPCRATEVAERINLTASQMKVRFAARAAASGAPGAASVVPPQAAPAAGSRSPLPGAPAAASPGGAPRRPGGEGQGERIAILPPRLPLEAVAAPLRAPSPPTQTAGSGRSGIRRVLPWLAVGAGAAAIGAGVFLLALDGDGTCTPTKTTFECPKVYDSRLLAIGLGAAGIALTGTGIYLVVRDAPNGLEAAVIGGPGSLALAGGF